MANKYVSKTRVKNKSWYHYGYLSVKCWNVTSLTIVIGFKDNTCVRIASNILVNTWFNKKGITKSQLRAIIGTRPSIEYSKHNSMQEHNQNVE